jgi:SM-20-related protein
MDYERLIDQILTDGYGVANNFLNPAEITALANQLHHRQANGQFRQAGTGNENTTTATVETQTRGDDIAWLHAATAITEETAFLARIGLFMDYMNQTCYLGLRDCEFHYASYATGTFYKRHLDRFKTDSHRKLSVICYLNHDWHTEDGGQLALYPIDNQGFESDRLEHAVLPATHERLSLTGWLRTG